MTFIHEKEDNVVRISSEKPIYSYAWPIITRMQPMPYNNFEYLKLRFAKNLAPQVFELCSLFFTFGVIAKDLQLMDDGLKIDKNKTIDCYELKLGKIGAIVVSMDEQQEYSEELKKLFKKIQ